MKEIGFRAKWWKRRPVSQFVVRIGFAVLCAVGQEMLGFELVSRDLEGCVVEGKASQN